MRFLAATFLAFAPSAFSANPFPTLAGARIEFDGSSVETVVIARNASEMPVSYWNETTGGRGLVTSTFRAGVVGFHPSNNPNVFDQYVLTWTNPTAGSFEATTVEGQSQSNHRTGTFRLLSPPFSGPTFLLLNSPSHDGNPASQRVSPGSSLTLKAIVEGTAPLNYQWIKDGRAIGTGGVARVLETTPHSFGTTSIDISTFEITLTLPKVDSSSAGSYQVLATNSIHGVLSEPAIIRVGELNPAP